MSPSDGYGFTVSDSEILIDLQFLATLLLAKGLSVAHEQRGGLERSESCPRALSPSVSPTSRSQARITASHSSRGRGGLPSAAPEVPEFELQRPGFFFSGSLEHFLDAPGESSGEIAGLLAKAVWRCGTRWLL